MAEGSVEQGLHLTRVYSAARARVWRAWTEPQALSRWFGPAETEAVLQATLDLREGGAWRIRFRTTDGEQHEVGGVYQVVEPLERLVFSWAWHSTPGRVSRVSVQLREVPGGTELDLRHDRFFDDTARQNHRRGWTGTLARLDAWLQQDDADVAGGR
jgi:uncharacterized protein YndB with AHSA1/START domain